MTANLVLTPQSSAGFESGGRFLLTNPLKPKLPPNTSVADNSHKIHFNQKFSILVVDDDDNYGVLLKAQLIRFGFYVETVTNLIDMEKMLQKNHQDFDAVLLDYYLGDVTSLETLRKIVKERPSLNVIMLTGQGTIDLAVESMELGAANFFTKQMKISSLAIRLRSILERKKRLHGRVAFPDLEKLDLIGSSPAFLNALEEIEQVKNVSSTVLLTGESGTGKELFAKALHKASKRGNAAFRAVNCAAIPENLIESELFGHKRGAFTDAKTDRKGLFEVCSEGSLLLDEIGEMPLTMQSKLLRVLQEREITAVGSTRPIKVNTRVIATTHRNLIEEVKAGKFREDLFFRLSVIRINVPSLRRRIEDIPLLVNNFLNIYNNDFSKNVAPPSSDLMIRLKSFRWPGNVRELRHAVERGVILSKDDLLHFDDMFPDHLLSNSTGIGDAELSGSNLCAAKRRLEEQSLREALASSNGNVSQAAKKLGLYRANVYRLLEKYKINQYEFKNLK